MQVVILDYTPGGDLEVGVRTGGAAVARLQLPAHENEDQLAGRIIGFCAGLRIEPFRFMRDLYDGMLEYRKGIPDHV